MKNKNIVLGITGSIAAYKAVLIIRELRKKGYNVVTIVTENALKFIGEWTLSTLSENKVIKELFEDKERDFTRHISLSKWADLLIVAPASANYIAKAANAISDDFLTTFTLSFTGPKLIAPAMNKDMYRNPIVQDNIEKLKKYGFKIITPGSGFLACGDIGEGRLAEIEKIIFSIEEELYEEKNLKDKTVLITTGATITKIDPIRYITNHSTGTMGYFLAIEALLRGAKRVILIKGKNSKIDKIYSDRIVIEEVETNKDMLEKVKYYLKEVDIFISAAAVLDFKIKDFSKEKIKKRKNKEININLVENIDILKEISSLKKDNQIFVGFSLETGDNLEYAKEKLNEKNLDFIVYNTLSDGEVFGDVKRNYIIIGKDKEVHFSNISKQELSSNIFRFIFQQ